MKKIISYIIIAILSLIIIGFIVFMFLYSNNKNIIEEYYTILESKSYIYKEDRIMSFSVYSTIEDTPIKYKDSNTYSLIMDKNNYLLEIDNIKTIKSDDAYIIKIESKIPDVITEASSINSILKITNKKFDLRLKIGSVSILKPTDYKLISLDGLYASYSYLNGKPEMVGINIIFNKKYDNLSNLKIGNYSYGILNKAIYNMEYDNEIDILKIIPSYSAQELENDYILNMEGKKYFIPISYKALMLQKVGYITFKLDNINYYFDTFYFMNNECMFNEYKDKMIKGEIKYA